MGKEHEFPEVLYAHLGTWEGTYTFMDPKTGKIIKKHNSRDEIGIRGSAYSQRSTYTWEDGRKQVREYEGRAVDGCLQIEFNDVKVRARQIGEKDMLVTFERPGKTTYEVSQLLGENKRIRVLQTSDGKNVTAVVHIEEDRVSKDDAFFEVGTEE